MKWQFSLNGWSDPLGIACLKFSLQNKDQIPMAEKHFRLSNTPETLSHSTRHIDVAQKMGFSADSHHNHIKKETNKNALWVQCCDCLPSQPVDLGGQNDRGTPQLSSPVLLLRNPLSQIQNQLWFFRRLFRSGNKCFTGVYSIYFGPCKLTSPSLDSLPPKAPLTYSSKYRSNTAYGEVFEGFCV